MENKCFKCGRVFSLDSGKIDFPVQIATIRMGLSIICFKGSQVDLNVYFGL